MTVLEIGVIGGDGIGPEVVRAGMQVLEAAAQDDPSLELSFTEFPWGCEYYLEHGRMMPEDGLETLADFDALYLGAVGWPTVPDHVSLWGLLLPIRRGFDQYFTRRGVERIVRYAYEEAGSRRGSLIGATKSNGISITMPFFDEVFREIGEEYPNIEASLMHADALAARLVLDPQRFDVVVGSNLLGDILSEVTAAVTGAIGIAPSANLNPEREDPPLFEPIHGPAPDIAGQGIANPSGAI